MADSELRVRGVKPSTDETASVQRGHNRGWKRNVHNLKGRLRKEWDSLLWIFGAFFILYYSEFASNLLFNSKIDWRWLMFCVLSLVVSVSSLLYLSYFKTFKADDMSTWDTSIIVLIVTICLSTSLTGVSFIMAAWRVWHLWTLLMVPVFFMSSISTVTLLEL